MPALAALGEEFAEQRPLSDRRVLLHMHLTTETVTLGEVLHRAGAEVVYLPSNRQPAPAVIETLARLRGRVLGGEDDLALLDVRQTLVVEGNGRIFRGVQAGRRPTGFFRSVQGISEHTSGGGRTVDAAAPDRLRVPVVAVYREPLKAELETGLGTSQSVAAALLRGLGRPLAGRALMVIGFGRVGRGVARTVRTLGARVTVADTAAEARLRAHLDGFAVRDPAEAIAGAEICITATGMPGVVNAELLAGARVGLTLANVSNHPEEIDLAGCRRVGESGVLSFWQVPAGGPRIALLGGGLQVNHTVEQGNPAELMDLSFAVHALVLTWLRITDPPPAVYSVPAEVRERAAALHLQRSG